MFLFTNSFFFFVGIQWRNNAKQCCFFKPKNISSKKNIQLGQHTTNSDVNVEKKTCCCFRHCSCFRWSKICTFSHILYHRFLFFISSLKLFSFNKIPLQILKTKIFLTDNILINFFSQYKKNTWDYNEWKIVINIVKRKSFKEKYRLREGILI